LARRAEIILVLPSLALWTHDDRHDGADHTDADLPGFAIGKAAVDRFQYRSLEDQCRLVEADAVLLAIIRDPGKEKPRTAIAAPR